MQQGNPVNEVNKGIMFRHNCDLYGPSVSYYQIASFMLQIGLVWYAVYLVQYSTKQENKSVGKRTIYHGEYILPHATAKPVDQEWEIVESDWKSKEKGKKKDKKKEKEKNVKAEQRSCHNQHQYQYSKEEEKQKQKTKTKNKKEQ